MSRDLREVVAALATAPVPTAAADPAAIAALELACTAAWPAAETHRLGDWLLRATGGWTQRANSVLPLGAPDRDLPDAFATVDDWYRQRGLAPSYAVPLPLSTEVFDALSRNGWRSKHTVAILTADITALAGTGTGNPLGTSGAAAARYVGDDPTVTIADRPDADWLTIVKASKRSLPDAALAVLGAGDRRGFGSVRDGEDTVAIGRVAVEGTVAHLSVIEVADTARRRGLGRRVMTSLSGWAADRGATTAVVQVVADNVPAVALYTALGYSLHHSYVNLTSPH